MLTHADIKRYQASDFTIAEVNEWTRADSSKS
jgi:hypothetical protein